MKADPILSILAERPKSSFQLCEELWQKHNIGRSATSKRLERLYKSGKVDRYLRIERGAWIYCIPSLHSIDSIQETARDIVRKSAGMLGRVFNTGEIGRILSIFELGRISNIKFFTKENQTSPKMTALISKLEKLGFRRVEQYLIHPSVPRSETNNLINQYNTSIIQEADLLVYARSLFIAVGLSERMTLYRQPSVQSLARHKFDLFGHGGRRNRIRVIVECNIRREITPADLEGFSQRIGGTIARSLTRIKQTDRSPIARYYIAESFTEGAKNLAAHKKRRIRLLSAEALSRGILEEKFPSSIISGQKPDFYGRYKEVRGIAFEAEIEPVYRESGYRTSRRKRFFRDGKKATDVNTGNELTDVDLYAEREGGIREIILVECKSGTETEKRTRLFTKIRRYWLIADLLCGQDKDCQIEIAVIANVEQVHREELVSKSKFKITFISPSQFYAEHQKALKGAPRWMFGV